MSRKEQKLNPVFGIKLERKLIIKRAIIKLCEAGSVNPEQFISKTVYNFEKNFLNNERDYIKHVQQNVEVKRKILRALQLQPFLKQLNDYQFRNLSDYFNCKYIKENTIFSIDDLLENFFIITCGQIKITDNDKFTAFCHEGDSFGSIDGKIFISANVVAVATHDSCVWYINQIGLCHALVDPTAWKRSMYSKSLLIDFNLKERFCGTEGLRTLTPFGIELNMAEANCACCSNPGPVITKFQRYYKHKKKIPSNLFGPDNILPEPTLLKCLDRVHIAKGHIILKKGQHSRNFFYILTGKALHICSDVEHENEDEPAISMLGPGDHFGSKGFLMCKQSTVTVKAISALQCMRLQNYLLDESLSEWFDYEQPKADPPAEGCQNPLCNCCCY